MPSSSRGSSSYRASRRGSTPRRAGSRSRGSHSASGPFSTPRASHQGRSRGDRSASSQRSRYSSGSRRGLDTSNSVQRGGSHRPRDSIVPIHAAPSVSSVELHSLSAGFRWLDAEDAASDADADRAEDPAEEVILAVDVRANNSMGCAYFSTQSQGLYLLNDVQSVGMDVLGSLVVQVQPTMVLTSFQAPESVIEYFDQDSRSSDNGATHQQYIMRTMPSADFNFESAMETLASLDIRSACPLRARVRAGAVARDPVLDIHDENSFSAVTGTRLGAFVNLDARISIGCAGALLKDVFRRLNAGEAPADNSTRAINSLQMFDLANRMLVNGETLSSLQIIRSELHPNSQIWGTSKSTPGAKESLSICGLLTAFANTSQGRTRLRQLILQPVIDIDLIHERQKMIALLLRPDNADALANICTSLGKLSDLAKVLCLLQKGVESAGGRGAVDRGAWWLLAKFALHVLHLREAVLQLAPANAARLQVTTIERIPVGVMKRVGELINNTIDFEEAKTGSRIAVKWGLNETLDRLKREYIGLPELLSKVSAAISREVPRWAAKHIDGCTFWPQLGFLTTVPIDPASGQSMYDGQGLDEDPWQKQFTANGMVYYKNRHMLELDACKGDMYGRILDAQVDIIHDLSLRVLERGHALNLASDAVGELDAIVALALAARKHGWSPPSVTAENILYIRGGRHPLQELVVDPYIPNDCYLTGGQGDMENEGGEVDQDSPSRLLCNLLVLTGPNHSGKSVYIKQVALIVYLAHIGSFVPADEAAIGITDQILTRISTRECVTENESAFAIDLRQIAFCLKAATRRSLLLIDEFGKGTRADDGAGLMSALLTHFLTLGGHSPRIIAATHFHEIFEGRHVDDHQLMFAHMDVLMNMNQEQTDHPMTFLYKLAQGRSSSSFGGLCASLNGVDGAVVDRAEAISLLLARNEDLGAACAKLGAEDQRQLEEAEAVAREFLSLSAGDLSRSGGIRGHLSKILQGGQWLLDE